MRACRNWERKRGVCWGVFNVRMRSSSAISALLILLSECNFVDRSALAATLPPAAAVGHRSRDTYLASTLQLRTLSVDVAIHPKPARTTSLQ